MLLIFQPNHQIDHTIQKKAQVEKKVRHKISSIPSPPKKKRSNRFPKHASLSPLKKKKKKERKKFNDTDFRVAPKPPIHLLYLNILSTPSATRKLDSVQ